MGIYDVIEQSPTRLVLGRVGQPQPAGIVLWAKGVVTGATVALVTGGVLIGGLILLRGSGPTGGGWMIRCQRQASMVTCEQREALLLNREDRITPLGPIATVRIDRQPVSVTDADGNTHDYIARWLTFVAPTGEAVRPPHNPGEPAPILAQLEQFLQSDQPEIVLQENYVPPGDRWLLDGHSVLTLLRSPPGGWLLLGLAGFVLVFYPVIEINHAWEISRTIPQLILEQDATAVYEVRRNGHRTGKFVLRSKLAGLKFAPSGDDYCLLFWFRDAAKNVRPLYKAPDNFLQDVNDLWNADQAREVGDRVAQWLGVSHLK
jgi:hypothetical protein